MKKIYVIWIWWIWISAIARYYKQNWFEVFWSDMTDSELISNLKNEWIDIVIWERSEFIDNSFEKVIYTEAIPNSQKELIKSKSLNIETLTYPEALAQIANDKILITISWTHWKSTTTSIWSIILKNSNLNFTSVIWTLLKEFNWKNFYHRDDKEKKEKYFIIEACEYKRSFLKYKPDIAIITNIEVDHLDYYKDEKDYILAYRQLIDNVKKWWYIILDWQEKNSRQLVWIRQDVNFIEIDKEWFKYNWQYHLFPSLSLKIPWQHIVYDARLTYILWVILNIDNESIIDSIETYSWAWRRMEIIWQTLNNNLVMSDYWHHPTEIKLTLWAIREKYKDKKILTIFQPHQYNRTIELLNDFKDVFLESDELIIPNIYESRDSIEDKKKINTDILLDNINHKNKKNWNWLENTLKLINEFDNNNKDSLIILMWAWDVDNLRYKIKTT